MSSKIGPFYKNYILTYFISTCKLLWNIQFANILGVIIKSGLELVKESVDNVIGIRIESDLSEKIKKEEGKGKILKYSLNDLDNGLFR